MVPVLLKTVPENVPLGLVNVNNEPRGTPIRAPAVVAVRID